MNQKHLTVKELPDTERPYEKFERFGAEALSDAELIAVIIRSGTKEERSVDLAYRILHSFGKEGNLSELVRTSPESLCRIKGIGRIKAIQILCAAELGRRMSEASFKERLDTKDSSTIADYYTPRMKNLEKEIVYLLHTDGKCRITGEERISVGTVNASLISPRDIFLSALEKKSVFIFLLHNHPSGDPSPSKEDVYVTKRVYEVGKLLGIGLMDHIIIGDGRYFSFKEEGYM